jgi:hypothetical protein
MQGSSPSLQAFSSLYTQAPSYIPHLRLHILARNSLRRSVLPSSCNSRSTRTRCFYTESPPRGQITLPAVARPKAQDAVDSSSLAEGPSLFDDILREDHPERLLYTLTSSSKGRRFVAQASHEDFNRVCHRMDPRQMFAGLKWIHRYIKPSLEQNLFEFRSVRPLEDRLSHFRLQITEIVQLRVDAGKPLTSMVCHFLLHCARELADGPMARHVWEIMIPEQKLQKHLRLSHHNLYMEAICWSNTLDKKEQLQLRVTPRNLALRGSENSPPGMVGHRVGPVGIRQEVLEVFHQMVNREFEGNEETFTNLMVAMGREGDLAGVKSVLRSVYNIDVDLLCQVDEEEVETPTVFEDGSSLRPTDRLLYTIAHVFGSNNQVRLANTLVSFVSRQYCVPITFEVWLQLLEWTLALVLPRATRTDKTKSMGKVHWSVLEDLWGEMTEGPCAIQPNIVMHMIRARSQQHRGSITHFTETMRFAIGMYEEHGGAAEALRTALLNICDTILQQPTTDDLQILPAKFFHIRRAFVLASLRKDRDLQLLIVAVRRGLRENHWVGPQTDFERVHMPNMVRDFQSYLPDSFSYRSTGGTIAMVENKKHRRLALDGAEGVSTANGLLRKAMDRHIATVGDLRLARELYPTKSRIVAPAPLLQKHGDAG